MKKLENITFIVAFRLDSVERLENLITILDFLSKLHVKIELIQSNSFNNHIIERLLTGYEHLNYRFIEDFDNIFHRTFYLNLVCNEIKSPFIAVWDADVLVNPVQIYKAYNLLERNEADAVYPYNGLFLNVSCVLREIFIQKKDISFLINNQKLMNKLYGDNFVGGGFFIRRESYIYAGMENENFYGWGPEDLNRIERWNSLNFIIRRTEGPMFHLNHPRNENGMFRSNLYRDICGLENTIAKYSMGIKDIL